MGGEVSEAPNAIPLDLRVTVAQFLGELAGGVCEPVEPPECRVLDIAVTEEGVPAVRGTLP